MKIRNKMLIIVSVTMAIVVLFLWIVIHTVLMSGFHEIENESAERDVKRVVDAIDEMINNVEIKSADWAIWDDTYRFVLDHNQDYIESNLTEETLGYLKINLLLIVDSLKNIVSSLQYDQKAGRAIEMSQKIKKIIINDSKFCSHNAIEDVTSGIIVIDDKPLIIVSRPILNSNGRGPIHGSLIFGQFLGDMEIKRLQEITHMSITFQNITSCDASDLKKIKPLLTHMDSITIKPLSETRLAGYTLIKDLHGDPALVIRIDLPRDIYKQGTVTNFYLIFSIIIATAIICIVISILLERIILSRIYTLNTDVNAITKAQDHSRRVKVNGKDEIANLSSSVNQMLSSLQGIEIEIEKKNQEMSIIMDSVPTGLLCLDENFIINPEHSKSVLRILELKEIASKDYFNVLGIENDNDKNKLLEFFDVFLENRISGKEMELLNPFEEFKYKTGNCQKWLRLRYFLVEGSENRKKQILVVMENITEEKALAEKVGKSEKENIELKAIAEDPDLFKEFLIEISQILKHTKENLDKLSKNVLSKDIVNDIFRDVHTIKGTAGSFGLITVSEIAGLLEENLVTLRENTTIHYNTTDLILNSLNQLSNAVMEVNQIAKTIFGEDFNESNDIYLRIPLEKLTYQFTNLKEMLKFCLEDYNFCGKLLDKIDHQYLELRSIPAKKGVAKALKIIPELLRRLEKNVVFDIKGAETPIDCEIAKELNTPLIHLIRNCAYHGIETSEDRLKAGKPQIGHINITFKQSEEDLIIELSDDGKGMDPDHLKKVAIKKGFLTEIEAAALTPYEAISLILKPGFSTTENVTEISGRGVGMDAVAVIIKDKLKGELIIKSFKGKGTVFSIKIPTVKVFDSAHC